MLCVGIDWAKLPETQPPQILPYLPAKSKDDQALTSDYNVCNVFCGTFVCMYVCTCCMYHTVENY